ncbi:MAG TPA: hypothetical protein VFO58_19115 [Vicinamibacterales bacterium]|nr:hypothetical protein [Vicinamibacterales bacterium]
MTRQLLRPAALGAAVHNGWAILVTIDADGRRPAVVDRRRVELIAAEVPSNPFHHEGLRLPLTEAAAVVERSRASSLAHARDALAALVKACPQSRIEAIALPEPRKVPEQLADVLASGNVVYVADRHMYEVALTKAAASLRLPVVRHPRDQEFASAAASLGVRELTVRKYLEGLRVSLGPPWQKDHRAAAAGAIGALGRKVRIDLRAAQPAR